MPAPSLEDFGTFLSAKEFSDVSGLGVNTVYQDIRTGVLPAVRLGGRLVIPKAAIQRLIDEALGEVSDARA